MDICKYIQVFLYVFLILFCQKVVWITEVFSSGMTAFIRKVRIRGDGQDFVRACVPSEAVIVTIDVAPPAGAVTFISGNYSSWSYPMRNTIARHILHLFLQAIDGIDTMQDWIWNKSIIRI
jgi:hypothetical protein